MSDKKYFFIVVFILLQKIAASQTWMRITDFPLAGLDTLGNTHNDMWRIVTGTLIWQKLDSIPSLGRKGGMCFNNAGTLYYTTGFDQSGNRIRETWKVSNPTSIVENNISSSVHCYPNPNHGSFLLSVDAFGMNRDYSILVYDISGNIVLQYKMDSNSLHMDITTNERNLFHKGDY